MGKHDLDGFGLIRSYPPRLTIAFCPVCRLTLPHEITPLAGEDRYRAPKQDAKWTSHFQAAKYKRQCQTCRLTTPAQEADAHLFFRTSDELKDKQEQLLANLTPSLPEAKWYAKYLVHPEILTEEKNLAVLRKQVLAAAFEMDGISSGRLKIYEYGEASIGRLERLRQVGIYGSLIAVMIVSHLHLQWWIVVIGAVHIFLLLANRIYERLQQADRWRIYLHQFFYPRLAQQMLHAPEPHILHDMLQELAASCPDVFARQRTLDAREVFRLLPSASSQHTEW